MSDRKKAIAALMGNAVLDDYYHHACAVLQEVKANLILGCKPDLAVALGVASLQSFRTDVAHPRSCLPMQRESVRIRQALQIAINHYGDPAIIEAIGADNASALREEYMRILIYFPD